MPTHTVISVQSLSKVFRLWRNPESRLRTAFWRVFGRSVISEDARDFAALDGVSFAVSRGESVGIIGLNGSGKSTLLQILAGTLQPTGGEVVVDGRVAALLELGAGFNPDFSGRENAVLNGAVLGISRDEIEERMPRIEAFAGIGEYIDQPVRSYSSGMAVRLAFAVLTQVEPDILIIDEALAVGDFLFQQKCFERMRQFRESGATFLFVSHSMGTVLELCSRAIVLDHGRVIFDGPSAEAVAVYEENAVRALYGAGAIGRPLEGTGSARGGGDPEARPHVYDLACNVDSARLASEPGAIKSDAAQLVFARLLDSSFAEKSLFRIGEDVVLSFGFRCNIPLLEPHLGFKVRDKLGRVIFETSSLCMRHHPASTNRGEVIIGNFRFRNILAPGEYGVTIGFSEGSVGECAYREALFYVHNVCQFTVIPASSDILWSGIAHLHPTFGWSIVGAPST